MSINSEAIYRYLMISGTGWIWLGDCGSFWGRPRTHELDAVAAAVAAVAALAVALDPAPLMRRNLGMHRSRWGEGVSTQVAPGRPVPHKGASVGKCPFGNPQKSLEIRNGNQL